MIAHIAVGRLPTGDAFENERVWWTPVTNPLTLPPEEVCYRGAVPPGAGVSTFAGDFFLEGPSGCKLYDPSNG
jgi:hypothetical protein